MPTIDQGGAYFTAVFKQQNSELLNANERDMPPLDKRQYVKMPEDPNVIKYESPNFGKLYGVSIA